MGLAARPRIDPGEGDRFTPARTPLGPALNATAVIGRSWVGCDATADER